MSLVERQIPDLSAKRANKAAYRQIPIDENHPLYRDPLVPLAEFGIAGHSYYSQPNKMTGEPLPGVNAEAYVRLDVGERLRRVNHVFATDRDVKEVFGGATELVVRDALRSRALQIRLWEEVWPAVIRSAHPDWTESQILAERPKFIAEPSSKDAPTPHNTGGAVDVTVRLLEDGEEIDFGHMSGRATPYAQTDYHEEHGAHVEEFPPLQKGKVSRRVLYWTMKGAGLEVNPDEWWHYGRGDALWAFMAEASAAYYGLPSTSPDIAE